MGQSSVSRLPEDNSIVHIVITIKVVPVDRIGVIVIVVLLAFMKMIQDSVCDSSNSHSVFADFLKKLSALVVFFGQIFFWCHFRMITELKYLSLMPVKHIERKGYVQVVE